jgi:hypothetical protein
MDLDGLAVAVNVDCPASDSTTTNSFSIRSMSAAASGVTQDTPTINIDTPHRHMALRMV